MLVERLRYITSINYLAKVMKFRIEWYLGIHQIIEIFYVRIDLNFNINSFLHPIINFFEHFLVNKYGKKVFYYKPNW